MKDIPSSRFERPGLRVFVDNFESRLEKKEVRSQFHQPFYELTEHQI